ncbi:putative multidrug resistance protein fnx1 [Xylariaceae sp. FL0016]|nr:putative multidrug resistance protein fnx1 [Xylariaceae sp. FL0016]
MEEAARQRLHDEKGLGSNEPANNEFQYITGWKQPLTIASLAFAIFLVNFEVTIVSTALVSISNDLQNYTRTSWVVTAYLITYSAGLVIWAKLSDILGRKPSYIATLLLFSTFSGGSRAAQTMIQLIVCRPFQGVGGGGVYAVALVMLYELVPKSKYPLYTAMAALANALGPIFGGLIARSSAWRWVFLLNVPSGIIIAIVVFSAVPKDFPYQGLEKAKESPRYREIDFTGALLLLAALALLIAGFEEAASRLDWTTAAALAPICVSAVAWIAFFASQWYFTRPNSGVQPVFPWRFCENREVLGLFLNSFFTGAVSITCIIQLPLRYQTTVGASPLQAGIRLLPFVMCGPIGATITAALAKGRKVAPVDIGLVAVASAVGTQMRFVGSAIVVAIVTAVSNDWIKDDLSVLLSPSQIEDMFRSTDTIYDLPESDQPIVRSAFVTSFNLQMHIVLGFAAASIFSILLMWKKNPTKVY